MNTEVVRNQPESFLLVSPARDPMPPRDSALPFIGASGWYQECLQLLARKATESTHLTIVGESGVGKTLAAHLVHAWSATGLLPCQHIDLRAMPLEMVESELFGYARTGFFQRSGYIPGRVAAAGEGICVIQGIERLPAQVQEQFVDWLADRAVVPVGMTTAEPLPARAIIELRLPTFPRPKESPVIMPLYELLKQSVVEIPPLSKRREDILPIAEHYCQTYAEAWGLGPRHFAPDAARLLRRANWRENVRLLMAAVAHALLGSTAEAITAAHLPPWLAGQVIDVADVGLEGIALEEIVERKLLLFFERLGRYEVHDLYDTVLQKIERPLLRRVLERTKGNQLRAARLLGINRNTLRTRLKALGLK